MKLYSDYITLDGKSLVSPCDNCNGNIDVRFCEAISFENSTTFNSPIEDVFTVMFTQIDDGNLAQFRWIKIKIDIPVGDHITYSGTKDGSFTLTEGENAILMMVPYGLDSGMYQSLVVSDFEYSGSGGNIDVEYEFETLDIYGCLENFPRVCGGGLTEDDFYIDINRFNYFDTEIRLDSETLISQHDLVYGASTRGQRSVRIEGKLISGGDCGLELGMKALYNMYPIEPIICPSKKGVYELRWMSNCCDTNGDPVFHFANVQLVNSKPVVTKVSERVYSWTVDLVVEDGVVYSTIQPITQTVEEGHVGGIDIGSQNWSQPWDDVFAPTTLELTDTQYSECARDDNVPLVARITATDAANPSEDPNNDPNFAQPAYVAKDILLMNVDTGVGIKINYEMQPNDIIDVDGLTGQVKLNGVVRYDLIDPDFSFVPSITAPDNRFVLHDDTFPGVYGKQIQAELSFYPVV